MQIQKLPAGSRSLTTLVRLAAAPAVGLGIGRFAYALLLPDMRVSLAWSYSQAGLMNTANAAGYMAGAMLAPALNARVAPGRAVLWGTLLVVASMFASGATGAFTLLAAIRFAAGFGAAFAFVAGGTLAVRISQSEPRRMSFLLGLFYAGPGFGILVSGLGVPLLAERLGPGTWWELWLALGLLSAILCAALIHLPEGGAGSARNPAKARFPVAASWPVLAGYFCFGVGYIAYMTFMIAWVRDSGGGPILQAAFWSVVGLGALSSPFVWSWVIARYAGGRALGILTGLTTIGAALPLAIGGRAGLFVSALLFGSAFFSVVAATTAFVRRYAAAAAVPAGIAVMTIVFSVGQTLGPFLTGFLIDMIGTISAGLWTSVGLLGLGAAVSFLQRELPAPGQG